MKPDTISNLIAAIVFLAGLAVTISAGYYKGRMGSIEKLATLTANIEFQTELIKNIGEKLDERDRQCSDHGEAISGIKRDGAAAFDRIKIIEERIKYL